MNNIKIKYILPPVVPPNVQSFKCAEIGRPHLVMSKPDNTFLNKNDRNILINICPNSISSGQFR